MKLWVNFFACCPYPLPQWQYDDEDDERETRRKKKKSRGRGFLIEEAEVDDEVEDDEEWEDGAEELLEKSRGRGTNLLDDELGGRDGDRHSHRRLQMMLDRKPDEIEDYYRRKYADKSDFYGLRGDQGDVDLDDDIAQQTFQPSVK